MYRATTKGRDARIDWRTLKSMRTDRGGRSDQLQRRPALRSTDLASVSTSTSHDTRQPLELMERWWGRQRPLQRGRASTPWVIPNPFLSHECPNDAEEKDQQAEP